MLDAVTSVLDDAIEEAESPLDQVCVGADLAHDGQESAEQSHNLLSVLTRIQKLSLLLMAHGFEVLNRS